jgi:hypothetical protein
MSCYSLSQLYLTLALSNTWKCVFGNPFVLNDVSDLKERAHVIASYERWLMEPKQAALVEKAKRELRGKVLGCWCKPLDCHGDVLKVVADETAEETEMRRVEMLKKSL